MKNILISLEEDLAIELSIKAANHDISRKKLIERLCRNFIKTYNKSEQEIVKRHLQGKKTTLVNKAFSWFESNSKYSG